MMILKDRAGTADKVTMTLSGTADVDTVASYSDRTESTGAITSDNEVHTRNTVATHDVCAGPAAGIARNVKEITVRNRHATASQDATILLDRGDVAAIEIFKATLLAGETLEYIEGIGWFISQIVRKEIYNRRVTADSVHATAATFADITGLNCPVKAGKQYNFEAHLFHIANATTTGAQFAIGGVAMTGMRISEIDTILGSLTAATMGTPTTDVTAINTAAMAETTGAATVVLAILSGWFNPSADGTFAVRAASEVTVAAGLTVKQGSWLQIWEADN